MYIFSNGQITQLEETTFAELHLHEEHIEEILRKHVEMICDDEQAMLIVGQQVSNQRRGRSDLTAIDNHGDLVLIEIKRDVQDIENRREPFEFQAIRYAASCATIQTTDDLIRDMYVPYIQRHSDEFCTEGLTINEIAKRKLKEFIEGNNITRFNARQRIVLVASDFDDQTLSAVAWLNSNHVDISCYRIVPAYLNGQILLDMRRILPIGEYSDFYVGIMHRESLAREESRDITRRSLPNIDKLLEWGVVQAGDIIVAKETEYEAELLENGKVRCELGIVSLQQWLKQVYGWASVPTYGRSVQKKTGKTLAKLREEYMEQNEML